MDIKVEDTGVLSQFPEVKATENKIVPTRILNVRNDSVDVEIELHYIGFPPEKRSVTIPSTNKLLIVQHLKQIWQELKPLAAPSDLTLEDIPISDQQPQQTP